MIPTVSVVFTDISILETIHLPTEKPFGLVLWQKATVPVKARFSIKPFQGSDQIASFFSIHSRPPPY